MSVTVEFSTFAKKTNSTKQPNHTTDVLLSAACTLKEPTDVINPVIRLQAASSPAAYTYAYIDAFDRFYFITEWTSVRATIWEASLREDFLASYKTEIGSASKYVLRAASSSDGSLLDTMYPTKGGALQLSAGATAPFLNYGLGSFVLGIIGAGTDTASMGAVQYYAFTQTQIVDFFNGLFGNNSWTGVSGSVMDTELQKMLLNPFQYIASAMFFPFDCTAITGASSVASIPFGWWTLPVSAYKLPKAPQYIVTATDIVIPKHPQAASRGDYLNLAPYSEYSFKLEPFGQIPLDSTLLYNGYEFSFDIGVDLISGVGRLGMVTLDNYGVILKYLPERMAQVGVPIELAQISRDVMTPLSNVAQVGANLLTGNIGGAVINTLSAVASTVGATFGTVETKGANGSLAAYMPSYPVLYYNYFRIADSDITEIGAPLCQTVTISTLSGYVLCSDGELDAAALLPERDAIRGYLTSGFFYE